MLPPIEHRIAVELGRKVQIINFDVAKRFGRLRHAGDEPVEEGPRPLDGNRSRFAVGDRALEELRQIAHRLGGDLVGQEGRQRRCGMFCSASSKARAPVSSSSLVSQISGWHWSGGNSPAALPRK